MSAHYSSCTHQLSVLILQFPCITSSRTAAEYLNSRINGQRELHNLTVKQASIASVRNLEIFHYVVEFLYWHETENPPWEPISSFTFKYAFHPTPNCCQYLFMQQTFSKQFNFKRQVAGKLTNHSPNQLVFSVKTECLYC